MSRYALLCISVLAIAGTCFGQTTGGRTDVWYDSGRDVVIATASSNPDYNTEYYYRIQISTYLNKAGFTQSGDVWGFNPDEIGPHTTYTETPSEPGKEFTALSYHQGVVEYQTYEVVYGCGACYDWYDPYGYFLIERTGDPQSEGPTFSVWVWSTPIIVTRVVQQVFNLGDSGGKVRPPGEKVDFDVSFRNFIPPAWVYGPEPGCLGADGRKIIYNGNKRGFTRMTFNVKTHSSVLLLPDLGIKIAGTDYKYTGITKRYVEESALAPDGVTLYEDEILDDCYKLDGRKYAGIDTYYIDTGGDGTARFATAHFYGGAANPLSPPGTPEINWDVTVQVSKSNPVSPQYTILFTHDCFPAHEAYIGTQRIHEWTPTGYNPITNISYCLTGFGQITGGPRSDTIY